jgi:hypothetical protein
MARCWEHAELHTTHAYGVEVGLSKARRRDVRKKFEDAGIKLSLASGFAYHWPDAAQLRENVEGTKEYTLLAHDIGARGIRVFPNAVLADKGIPEEQTLAQIGRAVADVGNFAAEQDPSVRSPSVAVPAERSRPLFQHPHFANAHLPGMGFAMEENELPHHLHGVAGTLQIEPKIALRVRRTIQELFLSRTPNLPVAVR